MLKYWNTVQDEHGNPRYGASVAVQQSSANSTIYSDSAGLIQATNPIITDSTRGYFEFYAAPGTYDLVVTGVGFASYTITGAAVVGMSAANATFVQSGTAPTYGWVSRTVQAKAGDVISVKDAKCADGLAVAGDGSHDDTTGIAALISYLSGIGGGVIYFPSGTYLCGQVAMASNVGLFGCGWSAILKLKANGNNYLLANTNGAVSVDNVSIRNLQIDGNKANNTSGGGIVLNGRNNEVIGCYIHDTVNCCIQFGSAHDGATDTPNAGDTLIAFNYCRDPGTASAGYQAIAVTHGTNVQVISNRCTSTDGNMIFGIDVEANSNNILANILVANNDIVGGRIGVDGQPIGGTGVANGVTLSNNNVDARGSQLVAAGANMAPYFIRQAKNVSISGGSLIGHDGATFGGIRIEDSGITTTYSVDGLTINGVAITSANAGVRTLYLGKVHDGTVAGNKVSVSSSANAAEVASCTNVGFSSNVFNNAGAGNSFAANGTNSGVYLAASNNLTGSVSGGSSAGVRLDRQLTLSANKGDQSINWVPGVNESTARFGTTLTADRSLTILSTTAWNGYRQRIERLVTAGGNFALDVIEGTTTLGGLAPGQWGETDFNGTTMEISARGDLISPNTAVMNFTDDFMGVTLDANKWGVLKGTDGSCANFAVLANQARGLIRGATGANASVDMAGNGIQICSQLNWAANLGGLVWECRVTISTASNIAIFIGLTNQVAALQMPLNSSGVSDTLTANANDAVGFLYDTAMATKNWWKVGVAGGVQATKASTFATPVGGTMERFRIEINASGAARFYRNGVLSSTAITGCVTNTVALTPVVAAFTRSAASANVDVDFMACQAIR